MIVGGPGDLVGAGQGRIRSPRLAAALEAAARGWPVFPLRPGSKVPAVKRWESQATTDPDRLARWWTTSPQRNPAIACGPAGLVVVDLDEVRGQPPARWAEHGVRHGRQVLALLAQWAGEPDPVDTYTVVTPRGVHRYFLAPPDRRLRNTMSEQGRGLGPGIDVRAWGGAVAAAGSLRWINRTPRWYRPHPHRPAVPVPLPRWLVAALTPPPPRPRTPIRLRWGGSRLDAYVASAVAGETDRIRRARPGTRAGTVFRAAVALGELVGAGVLDEQVARHALLDAASCHDGVEDWTPREARHHVGNGLARGRNNPRPLDHVAA